MEEGCARGILTIIKLEISETVHPMTVFCRCVFYISLCFMFYSIPYLFPLIMQYSARACDKLINGQSYLVFSGEELCMSP